MPSRSRHPVRRPTPAPTAKAGHRGKLIRKARAAVRRLAACRRMIKASLCRLRLTCGKPSCHCAKNARFRHPALIFTYKRQGRSMGLRVPKSMASEARQAAADYARLKKLINALSECNLKLFKLKAQALKQRS